jgi:hypothetical protein
MKSLKNICLLTLTATALAFMTASAPAQTTNKPKPATEAKETAKKPVAGPFHGKLAALDKNLKTITVGKRTFHITSETKIKKAGKPATLEDGIVGEQASGYVKPDENGNLIATTVNFGPKPASAVSAK